MRAVFADKALLQKWLDFEAALARAEAAVGLIPPEAADEISRKARSELFDNKAIKRGIDTTLHPLVPVIWQLAELCEGDAGRYVHWGATTQDVMDTALVLQIRDGLVIFEDGLQELQVLLAAMARDASQFSHRRTHSRTTGPAHYLRL